MNLTEWAHANGVHPQTARKWFREGNLPVPATRVGPRTILVNVEANSAASRVDGVGLYARVSSHDQKDDLARQTARLTGWAVQAGHRVVRSEAEVGSGMNGARTKVRRLLSDPKVTVVVVEHRDRLGRMNTELVEAAMGRGKRGKRFRRIVAGLPTGKFRDRLVAMAATAGLSVIAVDPAYTSRWGKQHWLPALQASDPSVDGHRAAAVVIGRRSLGHRARRKPVGPVARQRTRDGQPTRPAGHDNRASRSRVTARPRALDAAGPPDS